MGTWMSLEWVFAKDGFPETWKALGLLINSCMHAYTLSCLSANQLNLACWGSLAMNMACELQSCCISSSSLQDIVWQLKCQEGSHLVDASAGSWAWRMLTICLEIRLVQSSGDMQICKFLSSWFKKFDMQVCKFLSSWFKKFDMQHWHAQHS
jgi:hypothetical protein